MTAGVEASLDPAAAWSGWRPRAELLRQDLHELGIGPPTPLAVSERASGARAWGLQYVIEGSRLGGALLSGRLSPGLPRQFLADQGGGWRAFQDALEQAGGGQGDAWLSDAIRGARRVFDLYERAASLELAHNRV